MSSRPSTRTSSSSTGADRVFGAVLAGRRPLVRAGPRRAVVLGATSWRVGAGMRSSTLMSVSVMDVLLKEASPPVRTQSRVHQRADVARQDTADHRGGP